MMRDSRRNRQWVLMGIGAVLAYVLGVIGWATALPDAPWHEPFYRALQLFTVNAEWANDADPIPLILNFARFLAAIVAAVAVIKVVLALLQDWRKLQRALWQRDHVTIVGNGPEAVDLAHNYVSQWVDKGRHRRRRVVVIADLSQTDDLELGRIGGIVLPAVTEDRIARILQDSSEIIVVGQSDDETAELTARVAKGDPEATPMAVFDSPELTRHWEAEQRVRAHPVSRLSQVALTALRQNPPVPSINACPPPMVIGDGALAAELARRMVAGWQQPGERMMVHCLGEDLSWVERARSGLTDIADFQTTNVCVGSEALSEQVERLVTSWARPPEGKATVAGPTIVVALADEGAGVSLGAALLRNVPDVRVSVIVTRESTWRTAFGDDDDHRYLVGSLDVMSKPEALRLDRLDTLTDALLMDAADWAAEGGAVIGTPTLDAVGRPVALADQPALVRSVVGAIIGADRMQRRPVGLEEVLHAGDLELRDPGTVRPLHLLNPAQIASMRDILLLRLADVPEIEHKGSLEFWATETAARLPVLCSRAGWVPVDVSGHPVVLGPELVGELAPIVHLIYNEVSHDTNNATRSDVAGKAWEGLDEFNRSSNRAVVRDLPVKLATVGLKWCRSSEAIPHTLTAQDIERLAEAEHRRWARHQRHNGRPGHHLVIPWSEMKSDQQRNYDRRIVVGLIKELAAWGIQVERPADDETDSAVDS